MSYTVWRRKSDNSVVGFCESGYSGFQPGGDCATYTVRIEKDAPLMPAPLPTDADVKKAALLADQGVPQSVKDYLAALHG